MMKKETNKQYWKIEEFYLDQTPSWFVIQTAWMKFSVISSFLQFYSEHDYPYRTSQAFKSGARLSIELTGKQ